MGATGHDMGEFWDARAREDALYFVDNRLTYGHPDAAAFWAGGEEDLDRLLAAGGVRVEPEDTVLDLGCGVGRLTRVLAARAAHVHGVDVSAEMLARARDELASLPNVTLHQGDGLSLAPLGDGSMDAAVSHVVFQHIPDPEVTLGYVRELGRVLRPGGWAVFQISNDPGIHVARESRRARVAAALRRAPRGQSDRRWLGSSVTLDALRRAAHDGGMDVEHVVGEGTQFCMVRVRRR